MSQFIKDFSTITAPLHELTRKHALFKWQPHQQTALDRLKEALTSEDVIAYFDPNKETHLIVDTSPVGLRACLAQKVRETKDEYKVVAYASCSLSPTECRYAQTEREALSIVWGIECFSLYLLGAQFTLHTDHHPLETIFNNPKSHPPARIECWLLRLQPYNFRVVYLPGKDNPTDIQSIVTVYIIVNKQRHMSTLFLISLPQKQCHFQKSSVRQLVILQCKSLQS